MMTFKDLKKLVELPSYKEQRVPTVKALEVSGVPVVAEKILENHGSISVYLNGYVIYRAHVYMLSMIDEYDLQEFLTDEERNGKEEEEPAVVLPETKPEPEPDVEIEEPEQDDGKLTKILAIVFVLGVGGAGAFFYFYIYKPKQSEPEVSKENLEYEALPTKNEDEQDAETEE